MAEEGNEEKQMIKRRKNRNGWQVKLVKKRKRRIWCLKMVLRRTDEESRENT